jgi:hypothetical protein
MPKTVPSNGTTRNAAASKKPWRRAIEFVEEIVGRKDEQWVDLRLGLRTLTTVRPGGIVAVMGPSGGGKSSFVAGLLVAHARQSGPAGWLSCELPGDEAVARQVGMQCDASWEDVLRGRVARHHMEEVIDLPRLFVIERQDATMANLVGWLGEMNKLYRGEPILVAIDYTQIMPTDGDEAKQRIERVMREFDIAMRGSRAVGIAVNQMSRSNSRMARSGETVGMDTFDMGADSSAIERWASYTITLGGYKLRDDGTDDIQINVGKGRMDGGDRVYPGNYDGRTGRFLITGDAKSATLVRAERAAAIETQATANARVAIMGAAATLKEPVSRTELVSSASVKKSLGLKVLQLLIDDEKLVEVALRNKKGWKVCTPEMAGARQLPLVKERIP